jgi:hypothetical protein
MAAEHPPDGTDPVARVLDALADSWEHAASMTQRMLAGSYGADDAVADLALCSANGVGIALATVKGGIEMLVPGKARPNPAKVSVTVGVPRAMELQAGPFRAIGWANPPYSIRPPDVTMRRVPGDPDHVTVTVSFEHVSTFERTRTIIYEGHVHDSRGVRVAGAIRIPKPAH